MLPHAVGGMQLLPKEPRLDILWEKKTIERELLGGLVDVVEALAMVCDGFISVQVFESDGH